MFSTEWYRVADLRPKLRQHVELHRQRFRGLVWYILQDRQGAGIIAYRRPAISCCV